ncbi:MAG TPA: PIN domain-containing protein [Thermoanaerobaculia bacterium]|nr:PIN domain-containing protein [Thermoanaerobaculia bacterium]
MAVILDTGIIYAAYDRSDAWHERAVRLLESESTSLVIPSPVIPEVDHLLGRLGAEARLSFYRGLAESHYFVADLPREGYARVLEINEQFNDLDLGFVDAAVLAIAESLDLMRIATTDRRDFDPLAARIPFEILP